MSSALGGIFDAEATLRYLVRELSEVESPEPDNNPHIDLISGDEWEKMRGHRSLE